MKKKKRSKDPYQDDDRAIVRILRIARKAGAPTVETFTGKLGNELSELQQQECLPDPLPDTDLSHEEKWQSKIPRDRK